ncbi:MAG: PilZ domain-containing protein [Caldimicrobium sp.]
MKINPNKRRFPRFASKALAYFPGDPKGYPVKNLSWKGLFIKTEKFLHTKETLIYFELDLPEIGKIPMYGTIVHFGTPDDPGLGVEIIEIDKNLGPVWNLYIKALSYLREAKEKYDRIISSEELKNRE